MHKGIWRRNSHVVLYLSKHQLLLNKKLYQKATKKPRFIFEKYADQWYRIQWTHTLEKNQIQHEIRQKQIIGVSHWSDEFGRRPLVRMDLELVLLTSPSLSYFLQLKMPINSEQHSWTSIVLAISEPCFEGRSTWILRVHKVADGFEDNGEKVDEERIQNRWVV